MLLTDCLKGVEKVLKVLGDTGREILRQGENFGDLKNDTELRADHEVGRVLLEYFQSRREVGRITIEGGADMVCLDGKWLNYEEGMEDQLPDDAKWVCIDPLDGSLNYRNSLPEFGVYLPHAVCITVLSTTKSPTFNQVRQSMVYNLGGRVSVLANTDEYLDMSRQQLLVNGTSHHPKLRRVNPDFDPGKLIMLMDFYYPENRNLAHDLFKNEKGYFRSYGSASWEMALVAMGDADLYVSISQKQHELGAGYRMIKAVGGACCDFSGNDIGLRPYDFRTPLPVVMSAYPNLVEEFLSLVRRCR